MQFDIKYAYFNFLQSVKAPQEQRCCKSGSHASKGYVGEAHNGGDHFINEYVSDDDENHKEEMTLTT